MAGLLALACLGPAAASDAARARDIVTTKCSLCHGVEGEGSTPQYPRLAGQHAAYIARQLADFQSGLRKNPIMQPLVAELTTADFAALGAYFAARPTLAHPVADAALAARGRVMFENGIPAKKVMACVRCHGNGGEGAEDLPRLAGQHAQYLETQLRLFGKRDRTNDGATMQNIAGRLAPEEMKALAAYISGLK